VKIIILKYSLHLTILSDDVCDELGDKKRIRVILTHVLSCIHFISATSPVFSFSAMKENINNTKSDQCTRIT